MKKYIFLTFFIFSISNFLVFAQQFDSLLIEAIKSNNLTKVQELVKKGANVNCKYFNKVYGITRFYNPIHLASDSGYFEITKFLLEKGADINAKDDHGRSALHLIKTTEIARLLIEKGANVNSPDETKNSPLHYAVENKSDKMVALLLQKKVIPDQQNDNGTTPLLLALKQNNISLAKLLISVRQDVNKADDRGNSPLIQSILNNNPDIVKLLIDKKADVNLGNNDSLNPLLFAIGKPEIEKYLKSKGAIIKVQKPKLILPIAHFKEVSSVCISADGKYVLSGSWDNTLKLWDIASGKEIRTFNGHSSIVYSVCFSPDGKTALSGSGDKTLKLWDIATGIEIRTFYGHLQDVVSVCFSQDGKTVLSGSCDNTIKLWDIVSGKEIKTFTGHTGFVNAVCFSPDGKTILSGSDDKTIKLWDIFSGIEIKTLNGHMAGVLSICYSPDGKTVLSGSRDQTLMLWDIILGQPVKAFYGHSHIVTSVCFLPDGKKALSGSWDKSLLLWDIAGGKFKKLLIGHTGWVNSVCISPDGKTAVSGSGDNTLKLWDLKNGQEIKTFSGHTLGAHNICFSPDGKKTLSCSNVNSSEDNILKLWGIGSSDAILNFKQHHSNFIVSISFSPDGRTALTCSLDKTIKLWDVSKGQEIKTFKGNKAAIFSVCFSPDGKTFLSGSYKIIKLWDIASGQALKSFDGHSDWVWSVSFSPDGKTALSGSDDKSLKLWNIDTGEEIKTFIGHKKNVKSVCYSNDGKNAISGSSDNTVKVWDIASGNEIKSINIKTNDKGALCFSPNRNDVLTSSKVFLSNTGDNSLYLWSITTVNRKFRFNGHTNSIYSIAFHPSGKFAITSSEDNTMKIWDIVNQKELCTLVYVDATDWVVFTPDGYYATTEDGAKNLTWVKEMKTWNFDQWDLQYNRPDIVFSRMPDPDTTMINLYKKAYEKRLKKMNFNERMFKSGFHTPVIKIEQQNQINNGTVELDLIVTDTLYTMDRINVWVNDVPVFGVNGISLRTIKQSKGVPVKKRISLALNEGDNKIEASVLNSAGAESLKQLIYVKNEGSSVKKDLYFIGISCADYKETQYNLKFSVKDGRNMARQFAQATNSFSNIFIDTLFNANAMREKVASLKQKLLKSKVDDHVILFVSGHGLLDDSLDFYFASHDMDFKHPNKRGIAYDMLENLLDSIPARQKLLLIDACHSGELDKYANKEPKDTSLLLADGNKVNVKNEGRKGIELIENESKVGLQNSFELMQQLFANLNKGTGAVVISAAAGTGYALESQQWNNGVFTYSILNYLKDKPSGVTVNQLKEHVIKEVETLTKGQQKPTSRIENLVNDFLVW